VIRRAARRLAWSIFVVWATVTLAFVVSNVLPQDPARMIAGAQARAKDVERVRAQLGLDRPLYVQYATFLRRLVHAGPSIGASRPEGHATCGGIGPVHVDLGKSFQKRKPVVALISDALPRTLFLAAAATLLQLALGVASGTLAAARRGTAWDRGTVAVTLLGISVPTYMIGILLQWVFADRLRLLPLDGYGRTPIEHLTSVILPATTLGLFGAAWYTRLVRDEMIDLLHQDHVRTARAKGAGRLAVIVRHGLRNALVPLVTVVALDFGGLLGGAIVTESVFRWPGLGSLGVGAVLDRDGPVILGTVLVTAIVVVGTSLLADLAYPLLDPRVRSR
jgi:peptide/nickel transport system permease protein